MDLIKDIIQQSDYLKRIADRVLQLTHKQAYTSSVSIIKSTGITISTRYGDIENVEFNNNEILEVTVFFKQKKGTAFSNNLSESAIHKTVNAAIDIAHYTFTDPYSGIADKELLAFYPKNLDLCHPIPLDVKLGASLASQAEQTALKYDRRIVCTEGGKFNSYFSTKIFGNSWGILHSYSSSQHILSCSVVAESNGLMEQNYGYTLGRSLNSLCSPEWVGQECARKALQQLGSRKIKTIESSILFTAETSVSLFEHFASAIRGCNVYRRSTFLLHHINSKIFPSWMSIKECPHIIQGLGSAPFDNEGVQTLNRIIIKNGILRSWLLDSYSSRKIGLKSTGNAGGIYNWHVSYNDFGLNSLIKKMDRGLVVTNLMGQGVNIITGDYSRGVSGLWVEHGEVQYPVNEVTISGNLKNMFNNIVSIGNDVDVRNNIKCGSVLISVMKISGV